MKKKYFLQLLLPIFSLTVLMLPEVIRPQAPRVFTVEDFDLIGKVRSCEVITDYGKELFEFSEAGLLTKSVTRYNEQDYDISYYKYQGSDLSERRFEVYRDGIFDKTISMAHSYEIDTSSRKKITEKIVSYNEDFMENYEYYFDLDGKLAKVTRSGIEGLDETLIKSTSYKGENTTSHYLNGVIQKSVRTSFKKKRGGSKQKVELMKEYLKGVPSIAVENLYDSDNRLVSEQHFTYDAQKKTFTKGKLVSFKYDNAGRTIARITEINETPREESFIYQFDNGDSGNWVKKIVTPENTFTTRRIAYYPDTSVEE